MNMPREQQHAFAFKACCCSRGIFMEIGEI